MTEEVADLVDLVDQYGWAVRHVVPPPDDDTAGLSYTVGLTAMDHPEVVVQGLPADAANAFLNDVGQQVRDGVRFAAGQVTTALTDDERPMAFIAIDDELTDELTVAGQLYGAVQALQLVWPDAAGVFPWQLGYDLEPERQPLLGTWT